MNKYIWIIVIIIGGSCSEKQKSYKTIQGNWQIYSSSIIDSFSYSEIFIDSSYIHLYMEPFGLVPSRSYYIKGDSLYLDDFSEASLFDAAKVSSEDNLLKITTEEGTIIYRKLDSDLGLDKLQNHEIDVYDFGPAFYERMESWEKNKSMPTK